MEEKQPGDSDIVAKDLPKIKVGQDEWIEPIPRSHIDAG